ncbi:MAG: SRPBCC family protein [Thermomicrobiales bacterium]|nr:SRPBCC family protein [Thermomicrobiales bacterium]
MQDRIERMVTLPVSRERAWRAITDPTQINRWFDGCEMSELRAGAMFVLGGDARCRIEAVEPPRRFAYSWHPGSEQRTQTPFEELPLTLVEFTLDEIAGGTRLTVVETGFASLPAEMYERAFRENSGGWPEVLGNLTAYLASAGEEEAHGAGSPRTA